MIQPNEKAFIPMDEYEKNLIEVIENSDMVLQKPSQERLDMLQDSVKKTLKLQEAKRKRYQYSLSKYHPSFGSQLCYWKNKA